MRAIAVFCAVGCASVRPVALDPALHELYLVAFAASGPGYVVLERRSNAAPRLIAHDPAQSRSVAVGSIAAALEPWPGRDGLRAALEAGGAGTLLTDLGFVWAEPRTGDSIDLGEATARFGDEGAQLASGEHAVALFALPDSAPVDRLWLISSDGTRLGLEVAWPGRPATRAVFVAELATARSRLLSVEAYRLHEAGDYEAARARWERARGLDPTAADVLYNLACASARLGDVPRALAHLEAALAQERTRYAKLAARDPDFESLRSRSDFRALLTAAGE